MSFNKKIVLYFINGPKATEAQQAEASTIPFKVCFRNVKFVNSIEECDAVMGLIPDFYKDKPRIEDLLKNFEEQRALILKNQEKAKGLPPEPNKTSTNWPLQPVEAAKLHDEQGDKK